MNPQPQDELLEKANKELLDRRFFCGTRSELSRRLRDPFGWLRQIARDGNRQEAGSVAQQPAPDSYSEVNALIKILATLKTRGPASQTNSNAFAFENTSNKNQTAHYRALVSGLWALLCASRQVAQAGANDKSSEDTKAHHMNSSTTNALNGPSETDAPSVLIAHAARCFATLWDRSIETCDVTSTVTATSPDSQRSHTRFQLADLRRGPWENEIVYRILEDWGAIDHQPPPKPDVEVVTPIMAAQGTESGNTLWLRVRLYKHEQTPGYIAPLIPDLCAMALTRVDSECFAALSQVWCQTGLGRWMTGVWSLGEEIPEKFRKLYMHILHDQPDYPTSLGGPSAQAAMLVALLAATGQSDDYEPDQVQRPKCLLDRPRPPDQPYAEPLCLQSAISAQVENVPRAQLGKSGRSIRSLKLKPIGKEPSKADAAKKCGLRTAVFCHEEKFTSGSDWHDAEQKTQDTRTAYGGEYEGLWIERAVTVGDALDVLLEENRFVRAINLDAKSKWEGQWLPPQPQPAESAAQSDQSVPDGPPR